MPAAGSDIELMVTVKAYPNLGKHGEVVCIAGIRTDLPSPQWTRLFPIPFRDLPFSQHFKKYQVIRLHAIPHTGDTRPESLRPIVDSLQPGKVIKTDGNWKRRMKLIEPLIEASMCEIQGKQKTDGMSLGVFRPAKVEDLLIEKVDPNWNLKQQAISSQPTLMMPTKGGLEKIPYRFKYKYFCSDASCNGHEQSIIDWEIAQAYRSWRDDYGADKVLDKIKEKWLHEICNDQKDTLFFTGNQHQHPESFLILGTVYPKRK